MSYRNVFAAAPQKPIIAVCLAVTVLAAGWYGWNSHEVCRERGELSATLRDWATALLAGRGEGALSSAAPFGWDEVRIAEGVPEGEIAPLGCPFGGHWSAEERSALAQAGELTLFGFFDGGRLVAVGDFRRDWARFDAMDGPVPREAAVFEATGDATLSLVSQ